MITSLKESNFSLLHCKGVRSEWRFGYESAHGDQDTHDEPHLFPVELGTALDSCVKVLSIVLAT